MFLIAELAVDIGLFSFPRKTQHSGRHVQQPRSRIHQQEILFGLGVALVHFLLNQIDIVSVFLPASGVGIDPGFQIGQLFFFAGKHVAAGVTVQHALAVFVIVVNAGDLAGVFQLQILIAAGFLGNDG